MPIYEYQCKKCDKIFEEWTKHVEEADVTHPCPDCAIQCGRLMSQTTFVLAGGGWYATDYGNRRPPAGEAKPQESSAPAEKAESPKESSGPAKKAESPKGASGPAAAAD